MVLTETPAVNSGETAPDFCLQGTTGNALRLDDCVGKNGTVVMFICNHCPYVKAIQQHLVDEANALLKIGVKCVAIMPNDTAAYPDDSLENMQTIAARFDYPFPYLIDATQQVARAYGAVCTPDFFGYNAKRQLQYRGRLNPVTPAKAAEEGMSRDLFNAMQMIVKTGHGPDEQWPSLGCSIKWKD